MNIRNRVVDMRMMSPKDISFNERNWRTHPEKQSKALAGMLEEIGIAGAMICYYSERNGGKLTLIDGHLRKEIAPGQQWPALITDLTDAEADTLLAAFDPISAMAGGDKGRLEALLKDMHVDDARLQELMSQIAAENSIMNRIEQKDAEPRFDIADQLCSKWGVEVGQLWELGEHLLFCGDCTKTEDLDRLMAGGKKAQMLFTSPPYAAQREYKLGEFDWLGLMIGMASAAIEIMQDNASMLINLGLVHSDGRVYRYWDPWLNWMEENNQPLYGWYVWDKLHGLMGDWKGRLAPAHEWLFHFAKKPRRANKTASTKYAEQGVTHYNKNKVGLREKDGQINALQMAGQPVNQTKVIDSVIRCQPALGGVEGHPAPFSIPFAQALVEVYANIHEIVYEPFAGSGTTIIACENLNRKCCAIEIDPGYIAVAIQRFADATGKAPQLKN